MKIKRIQKIGICILTILLTSLLFAQISIADVGSFESYDSGSDWGGSSWDSDWGGSSWGSSWDYDDDYDGGYFGGFFGGGWFWIIFVFVMIVIANAAKSQKRPQPNYSPNHYDRLGLFEEKVLAKIKEIDPEFNKTDFIEWAKTLFVKLQESWTACDWETIRTFETKELFEQHKAQLQGYINNHTINVMSNIRVNQVCLYQFRQEGGKDILTVELNSTMKDYIMDANTGKVLQGDKITDRTNTYLLTFVRSTGVKTTKEVGEVDTICCPNCGAPTKVAASGKCEYCGSVITTDTHDWSLSNLQRK